MNISLTQDKNGDAYVSMKNKSLNKPGMILFHATWCGHCVRFMPVFEQLKSKLGDDFPCLAVESDEISDMDKKIAGIRGFPTIKFFDQTGRIVGDYNGERSVESMLNYICNLYHHCIKYH